MVLLVMALAPWLTGLILAAAEVRELAASQLRTVVWGVLAMGGSAVLVGVMRGSGTVMLPALLGMAAVLLLELPLAMWLQARHGLAGLWWAWPLGLLAMLVMMGSSNAVNLTDGLDGLAIGCTLIVTTVFLVFTYIAGNAILARYLFVPFVPGAGELTVFCAAMIGASLGFLWFNCHPAQVFMGDTGSLALGGALAGFAPTKPARNLKAERDVLLDGPPGKERIRLWHPGKRTWLGWRRAVDQDRATIGRLDTRQDREQRRLATARWAEDRDELPLLDTQRDTREHVELAVRLLQLAHLDHCGTRFNSAYHGITRACTTYVAANKTSVSSAETRTAANTRSVLNDAFAPCI